MMVNQQNQDVDVEPRVLQILDYRLTWVQKGCSSYTRIIPNSNSEIKFIQNITNSMSFKFVFVLPGLIDGVLEEEHKSSSLSHRSGSMS